VETHKREKSNHAFADKRKIQYSRNEKALGEEGLYKSDIRECYLPDFFTVFFTTFFGAAFFATVFFAGALGAAFAFFTALAGLAFLVADFFAAGAFFDGLFFFAVAMILSFFLTQAVLTVRI